MLSRPIHFNYQSCLLKNLPMMYAENRRSTKLNTFTFCYQITKILIQNIIITLQSVLTNITDLLAYCTFLTTFQWTCSQRFFFNKPMKKFVFFYIFSRLKEVCKLDILTKYCFYIISAFLKNTCKKYIVSMNTREQFRILKQ